MNVSHASAARGRYLEKAREAISFGDRVMAENFFQHADHYNRIVISAEERRQADDAYSNKREPQEQAPTEEPNHVSAKAEVIINQVSTVAFASGDINFDEKKPDEFTM